MTQQVLNGPDAPHIGPHSDLPSAERGDPWKVIVDAINANFTELYTATTPAGGTAAAGVTVSESGAGPHKVTILTFTDLEIGLSGDDEALALGKLMYSFPSGDGQASIIRSALFTGALTLDDAVQTDTPEVGLGTTEAEGAEATLGDVAATAEDIIGGVAVDGVAGEAFEAKDVDMALLLSADDDARELWLNIAGTWSDLTAPAAITATGQIVIEWTLLGNVIPEA